MKTLWAPWRIEYLTKGDQKAVKHKLVNDCIFCDAASKEPHVNNLVLYKGKKSFVIMNKYPYSNGHLMVIPYRHLADLSKLSKEEHAEMGKLMGVTTQILKKYGHCDGFNLGMNLGQASGAGVKDHLHYHIVPRWAGDHNFMPVLADARVVPEHLHATYKKLRKLFKDL